MNAEKIFRVSNLTSIQQQQMLFAPVSFELGAGEMVLIEGPNGSGKTSLLRMLTGLSAPSQGEIFWEEQLIQSVRDEYVNHMHYIGHQNGLKLGLTVAENLALMRLLCSPDETFFVSSGDINLQPVHTLSAGQKRNLALQKLFLFPKPLWLLDEPLTALDANAQTIFLEKLETHIQQGGMCVATSHQPLPFKKISPTILRLQPC